MSDPSADSPGEERPGPEGRSGGPEPVPIHVAELWCEVCERPTPHRILHRDRRARKDRASGIARCRVCRSTHPFRSEPPARRPLRVIVSDGPASSVRERSVPPGTRLEVGMTLEGGPEGPPLRLRRLDLRSGGQASAARAEELATVWASAGTDAVVAVSLVDGRATRPFRLRLEPVRTVAVGDRLELEGQRVVVHAVRARGRTWTRIGDAFRAEEIERIYARRYRTPPAGSQRWSSERPTPSTAANARSTASRSRSSPGRSRTRTRAGGTNDSGGATIHRSAPS